MSITPLTSQKACAECWLFTAMECDGEPTPYGICDIDGEQVLAENPSCDSGRTVTSWGRKCAGGDES